MGGEVRQWSSSGSSASSREDELRKPLCNVFVKKLSPQLNPHSYLYNFRVCRKCTPKCLTPTGGTTCDKVRMTKFQLIVNDNLADERDRFLGAEYSEFKR